MVKHPFTIRHNGFGGWQVINHDGLILNTLPRQGAALRWAEALWVDINTEVEYHQPGGR